MSNPTSSLLDEFEQLEIDPHDFHHVDHVRVAYEILNKYDFVDACARYANTIRAMAENVGAAEKFNATITFAFMSLIAERKRRSDSSDVESFLASNSDLLDKDVLKSWYSNERLTSSTARRQFVLPDRALGAGARSTSQN